MYCEEYSNKFNENITIEIIEPATGYKRLKINAASGGATTNYNYVSVYNLATNVGSGGGSYGYESQQNQLTKVNFLS